MPGVTRRTGLTVGCSLVLAAVVGCSGASSGGPVPQVPATGTATATPTAGASGGVEPQPTVPLQKDVAKLNQAIADQSCPEYAALVFSVNRQTLQPGAGPVGSECSYFDAQLQAFKGTVFDGSTEFGTAGVIDGTNPSGDNVTLVMMLDRDGVFRYDFSVSGGDPQVGTKPGVTAATDANVQSFLDGLKQRDCTTAGPLIYEHSPLLQSGKGARAACERILQGELLVPELLRTDSPTAQRLGATADFGFYGLPTADGWFTVATYGGPTKADPHPSPDFIDDVVVDTDVPGIAALSPPPTSATAVPS
jgi:hypothetical protein